MPFDRLLTALVLLMFVAAPAAAAPSADLWDRWTAHVADSDATVDHAAWDSFLKTYVRDHEDGIARVAYADVTRTDRDALDAYVAALEGTAVDRLGRPEQMAYWINLYNVATVRLILDHYPVDSIRDIDISPGLFSSGPWGKKLLTVQGEALSLDDIEHRILRPIWRDPRIHYAVNCASLGCPNLVTDAFTKDNTEQLLEMAARAYVNHPRGATVSRGKLTVSSIYDWFKVDFGGSQRGVIDHLTRYADEELAASLGGIKRISGHRYDWSLNDTGPSS